MNRAHLLFVGLLFLLIEEVVTECPHGFESNGRPQKCTDIDECKETEVYCGSNSTCSNTDGSYSCSCNDGFVPNKKKKTFKVEDEVTCQDFNECLEQKEICGDNSKCNNIDGSYFCTCKIGFVPSNGNETFKSGENVTCGVSTAGPHFTSSTSVVPTVSTAGTPFTSGPSLDSTVLPGECICGGGLCDGHECVCHRGFTNYGFKNMSCSKPDCEFLKEKSPEQISSELEQIMKDLRNSCMNADEGQMDRSKLLEKLLNAIDKLLSAGQLNSNRKVTSLLEITERALKVLGPLLPNVTRSTLQTQIQMLVRRDRAPPRGLLIMSTDGAQLDSHWETAAGDSYPGFAAASLLRYKSLGSSVNDYFSRIEKREDERLQINSDVVSVVVTNRDTAQLKKPVNLTFTHLQPSDGNHTCVFWDSTLDGGAWSTRGCTVVKSNTNQTVCSCTHLSSFAVLMALYEKEDVFELQLITWIGLSLSLICLFVCILTFRFVRSIQSTRTTIHLHLCISLFIANLVFLAGITQTGNRVGCAFVAGLLHFFFLAAFCWMCLEGVQLFRMVVLVFNTTLRPRYLMASGYGVPALVVAISAIANAKGYGTKRHCWLNLQDGFIWSFFGPVCLIIVVNVFFFLITVWKLAQKFSSISQDLSNLHKIKSFTITAIAQLCVLGTMWIFGCFQFEEQSLVIDFIFTILNSLQGVLVFVMHCLFSKQVREEYAKILTRMCAPQKRKYSEFSSNQTSKSQGSASAHHTGESHI